MIKQVSLCCALLLFGVLTGCGTVVRSFTSDIQSVPLDITPKPQTTLNVMPFEIPIYTYADGSVNPSQRGDGFLRKDLMEFKLLPLEELSDPEGHGLIEVTKGEMSDFPFDHFFGETDFLNLREALITSVKESNAFKEVVNVTDVNQITPGLKLYVTIEESGEDLHFASVDCTLNGKVRIEDENNKLLIAIVR